MPKHQGSSLVFLGFSIIAFVISYGLMFTLVPTVLGSFFSATQNVTISDPTWRATQTKTIDTLQFLIPLVPAMGIFVLVLKVLMVASVRGRD